MAVFPIKRQDTIQRLSTWVHIRRRKWMMIRLLLGSEEDYEDGYEVGPIDGCGDGWLCCWLTSNEYLKHPMIAAQE